MSPIFPPPRTSFADRCSSALSITPRAALNAPAAKVIRSGFSLWGIPAERTAQSACAPNQIPQVRQALGAYRKIKQSLEAISELNQFLLRLDREESKQQESQP